MWPAESFADLLTAGRILLSKMKTEAEMIPAAPAAPTIDAINANDAADDAVARSPDRASSSAGSVCSARKRARFESGIADAVERGDSCDRGIQTGPTGRRRAVDPVGDEDAVGGGGPASPTVPSESSAGPTTHRCQTKALRSFQDLCGVCVVFVRRFDGSWWIISKNKT